MVDVASVAHAGTYRTFQFFVCQYEKFTVQKRLVCSKIYVNNFLYNKKFSVCHFRPLKPLSYSYTM